MSQNKHSKWYDYVIVTTIFLENSWEYFHWWAELHLKNLIEVIRSNWKSVLVIQKWNFWKIIKDNIEVHSIDTKSDFLFKLYFTFLLRKYSYRHVHFNNLWLDTFVIKKKGVLYTATFHWIWWDFPTSNFPKGYFSENCILKIWSYIKKKIMIFEQNISILKLDKIISVDSSLLRYCQQFYTNSRNKIKVIYNYVDKSKFSSASKNLNKWDELIILYPRNISFARWVHLLVPIAIYLNSKWIKFVIKIVWAWINQIGWNKYEKTLKNEISLNKLDKQFEFLWRLKHSEIINEFTKSHIVIIPSFFSEWTSLSCLEWMATWNIVISSNIWWLNDIIIDWFNGFICDPDPELIAKKIEYAAINYNEIIGWISDASDRIINNSFNYVIWEKNIQIFFWF